MSDSLPENPLALCASTLLHSPTSIYFSDEISRCVLTSCSPNYSLLLLTASTRSPAQPPNTFHAPTSIFFSGEIGGCVCSLLLLPLTCFFNLIPILLLQCARSVLDCKLVAFAGPLTIRSQPMEKEALVKFRCSTFCNASHLLFLQGLSTKCEALLLDAARWVLYCSKC